ncbi:MAG TPA: hypothetical protein VHC90_17995 [Bryobacteraceae bacterium]|nr:hypothetical protein [Bryobacteraceae bacterium]
MPVFRVHRMKEAPRQQFRNAAHTSGAATAKPKDYEPSAEVEALSEYAAWALMRETESPLHVGDLLESGEGRLRICKYVGFEDARWFLAEPAPGAAPLPGVPPVALPDAGPQPQA